LLSFALHNGEACLIILVDAPHLEAAERSLHAVLNRPVGNGLNDTFLQRLIGSRRKRPVWNVKACRRSSGDGAQPLAVWA
jgi:hypothetical protein